MASSDGHWFHWYCLGMAVVIRCIRWTLIIEVAVVGNVQGRRWSLISGGHWWSLVMFRDGGGQGWRWSVMDSGGQWWLVGVSGCLR